MSRQNENENKCYKEIVEKRDNEANYQAASTSPSQKKCESLPHPYYYLPLRENAGEIRLLTLLPGDFDDRVRMHLEHVIFTHDITPNFEALSYAWGSINNREKILVGPFADRFKSLAINKSLEEALRYLRYADRERTLWIDAICVNQDDLEERSSQVQKMANIYTKAARVIAWLGSASHNSKLALDTLNWIASKVKVELASEYLYSYGDLTIEQTPIESIIDLINRSWFERLWILQEIKLGGQDSHVMCGLDTMPWLSFHKALFAFCSQNSTCNRLITPSRRLFLLYLCQGQNTIYSFTKVMHFTRIGKCSDQRDRVFAIFSILSDFDKSIIPEPNYNKTVSEVYTDTAIQYIKRTMQLRILSYADIYDGGDEMPSWVPNWANLSKTKYLPWVNWPTPGSSFTGHIHGSILSVTGIEIGTTEIDEVDINVPDDKNEALATFKRLAAYYDLSAPYVAGGTTLNAFICSLRGGCFADTYNPPLLTRMWTQGNILEMARRLLGSNCNYENFEMTASFLEEIFYYTLGRTLFRTNEGLIGLGPKNMKAGDIVAVLLGAKFVLIIRPSGNEQYKFIGIAYCHGIMHGEALLGSLPNNFTRTNKVSGGYSCPMFLNHENGKLQHEDPRKGPLPPNWHVSHTSTEDIQKPWYIRGSETIEEETYFDPRMTKEALEEQGVVGLRTFNII